MIKDFYEIYRNFIPLTLKRLGAPLKEITSFDSSVLSDPNYITDRSTGFDITPLGNPVLTDSSVIYAGRTILTNNSDVDQKLRTDSFTHQESFSTTSKTTNGFKLGLKASTKFTAKIADVGFDTSVEISTEYNFSKEETNTSTVTKTINIPSQEIIVPAHTAVEVVAFFTKGTAKGKVRLSANFVGEDKIDYTGIKLDGSSILGKAVYGFGAIFKYSGLQEEGFNYVAHDKLSVVGEGEYTCEAANQYKVSITPIINGRRGIETKVINVTPEIK